MYMACFGVVMLHAKDLCGCINGSLVINTTHILTATSIAKRRQPRTARKLEKAHDGLLARLEKINGEILRRQALDRGEIMQEEGEPDMILLRPPRQPRTAYQLARKGGRILASFDRLKETLHRQELDREKVIQKGGEKKEMA